MATIRTQPFPPTHSPIGRPKTTRTAILSLAIVIGIVLASTQPTRADQTDTGFASTFAGPIEAAHGLAVWQSHEAIQANFALEFSGKPALTGTMLFDTSVSRVRMELVDGTLLVFDGQSAWISPAESAMAQARFHLLTWPYFMAASMKLRDPGTHLTPLDPMPLHGQQLPAATLTFDSEIGDSPDDWYILYRDPMSQRLAAMAYIVTYGGVPAEEAEKEVHAITYDDFQVAEGVTLVTRWSFWMWNAQQGTHGQPMGQARLTNIKFTNPQPDAFKKPTDARRDSLPK